MTVHIMKNRLVGTVVGLPGSNMFVLSSDRISDELRMSLDVPLLETEARQRTLPCDLNRLVVAARSSRDNPSEIIVELGRWVWLWRRPSEKVYAMPIILFVSDKTFVRMVDSLRVRVLRYGDDVLVACDSETQLSGVMQKVECEELAIFYALGDHEAYDTMRAVANHSEPYSSHNAPFFVRQSCHGGFVFFGRSHLSLEVLGNAEFVLNRCVRALLVGEEKVSG